MKPECYTSLLILKYAHSALISPREFKSGAIASFPFFFQSTGGTQSLEARKKQEKNGKE